MKAVVTPPQYLLLAYYKHIITLILTSVLVLAGSLEAKENATTKDAPQQGLELLFPAGTGKRTKGAKLSKEQKEAASLFKKLKVIEKGGKVDATDKSGQTALMHAAAQGNMAAVCCS